MDHEQSLEDSERLPDLVVDPTLQVQEKEALDALLAQLQTRLTPLEYRVLLLRLGDCSYAEIAARLGVTTKAVDNAIQRIRRKIGKGWPQT